MGAVMCYRATRLPSEYGPLGRRIPVISIEVRWLAYTVWATLPLLRPGLLNRLQHPSVPIHSLRLLRRAIIRKCTKARLRLSFINLKAILQEDTDSRLHFKPQVIGQILIIFVVKVEVLNIQTNIDIFREPVFHFRSDCVDFRCIG